MGKNEFLTPRQSPTEILSQEAEMVLPDVPEAMPRRERLQVPLHEREPPASDATFRPERRSHPRRFLRGVRDHFPRSHET
ncbi:hypothetical protein Dsin_028742 [Dipteronia sinensis]|uniref:Uncharacterized protein n=1 Tax=Dipteronia sinensis TaxID=43782 RepID=A0AAD9ZSM3_9ROSI|nr:hypothetical protein Dsin_028742 [Dipteronia sinensis]